MKFIPPAIAGKVARQLLIIQKNSPQIMFGAGITGILASTFLACRATLFLEDVVEGIENEITEIKDNHHVAVINGLNPVKPNRELAFVYGKGAMKVARLYAPSFILGGASVASLTGSHVTLTRRNAGLTAAYAGLATGFDEYRARVKEELGEEKERDVYHGIQTVKVKNEETGKTETVKVIDPNTHTAYSRFFDEYNRNWQKDPSLNRVFVQCQQQYMNDLLHARGHVFLNEVYDALGFDHSRQGAIVGWVTGPNGKDQFIDFKMFEARNANFVNGHERSILLDFNVDGPIYNLI